MVGVIVLEIDLSLVYGKISLPRICHLVVCLLISKYEVSGGFFALDMVFTNTSSVGRFENTISFILLTIQRM